MDAMAIFEGAVRFDDAGLVPVVVQDDESLRVLMLAFMNEEALRLTQETGRAHYWSRSRNTLWRKGETSGNEQVVTDLRVNCEQNSLLMSVIQQGAVCHDGYATCYYRRLNQDGSLQIVEEREFDPELVYGEGGRRQADLVDLTRLHVNAYRYLRDHDLEAHSGTSRMLRDGGKSRSPRVADELEELAGVLSGDHQHTDPTSDTVLEASQVLYWLIVEALRSGYSWEQIRPDRAFAAPDDAPRDTVAHLLQACAAGWRSREDVLPEDVQSTLALVAAGCRAMDVEPFDAIEADLAELRQRPYLADYFTVTE